MVSHILYPNRFESSVVGRLIRRKADVNWLTKGCRLLTPLQYFLEAAVKEKRYADKPKAIEYLKSKIRFAIRKSAPYSAEKKTAI